MIIYNNNLIDTIKNFLNDLNWEIVFNDVKTFFNFESNEKIASFLILIIGSFIFWSVARKLLKVIFAV